MPVALASQEGEHIPASGLDGIVGFAVASSDLAAGGTGELHGPWWNSSSPRVFLSMSNLVHTHVFNRT